MTNASNAIDQVNTIIGKSGAIQLLASLGPGDLTLTPLHVNINLHQAMPRYFRAYFLECALIPLLAGWLRDGLLLWRIRFVGYGTLEPIIKKLSKLYSRATNDPPASV
jgi:hypothetical protein